MKNDNKPLNNWPPNNNISEIIKFINDNKGDVSTKIIYVEKLFE